MSYSFETNDTIHSTMDIHHFHCTSSSLLVIIPYDNQASNLCYRSKRSPWIIRFQYDGVILLFDHHCSSNDSYFPKILSNTLTLQLSHLNRGQVKMVFKIIDVSCDITTVHTYIHTCMSTYARFISKRFFFGL